MASSPSSSPATSLPSDCWLAILEHLSPEDYWPLLFVSKDTKSLVEPFLFKKLTWDWRPIPFRRILLLFRAILERPERAFDIHHLSLLSHQRVQPTDFWEPPSCEQDCKEEIARFTDVLRHAQTIVQTTGFPDADSWVHALQDGDPYALVSILLSQLHNLRSLRLDYSFVWQSGFPGLMLRHALFSSSQSSLSRFHSLTEVDYGGNVRRDMISGGPPEIHEEPGYPQCNPAQFPAWFYLPSLQSLAIWLRTKQDIELPERCPSLSRLRCLILARTTIREGQVPSLLSLCPRLKTLHLGMAYRWGKEIALQNGPAIIQGLESIRETLENLSFGVEYFPPTHCNVWLADGEKELTTPFYRLLTRFPSLRSVEMPVNLLAGWSRAPSTDLTLGLPDTIEQLCLRADYQTVDEEGWQEKHILDLCATNAARLRMQLPGLKRLCVRKWSQFWSTPMIDRKRDAARAACAQEGICLEVISDHVSNGIWTETRMCPERKVL
ncbi:uncharacterized protein N7459_000458 [Penicillium hispanicum]|uniref:uncharacterized protein n=1 Tax=Penicillium hispanicum TaxID=1080232 RepID=UPI0025420E61|nr:uncharacterized protein N7459_000458 [Penicillium hispanicum]KAJ5594250.1 hypothetical protein N7459_000458 [Penicillium hispanicum]